MRILSKICYDKYFLTLNDTNILNKDLYDLYSAITTFKIYDIELKKNYQYNFNNVSNIILYKQFVLNINIDIKHIMAKYTNF